MSTDVEIIVVSSTDLVRFVVLFMAISGCIAFGDDFGVRSAFVFAVFVIDAFSSIGSVFFDVCFAGIVRLADVIGTVGTALILTFAPALLATTRIEWSNAPRLRVYHIQLDARDFRRFKTISCNGG